MLTGYGYKDNAKIFQKIRNISIASISILMLLILVFIVSQQTVGETLVVSKEGGDYGTIQEAINAAQAKDTIIVYAGTYEGPIAVNKSVELIGNGSQETILTTNGDHGMLVTAPMVNISGFKIIGGDRGIALEGDHYIIRQCTVTEAKDGIDIHLADHIRIEECVANENEIGIHVALATNIELINNSCYDNQFFGIYLFSTSDCNLGGNNCSNNDGAGIGLQLTDNITIFGSSLISNLESGLYVKTSSDIIIKSNLQKKNVEHGTHIKESDSVSLDNNSIYNNGNGLYIEEFSQDFIARNNDIWNNTFHGLDSSNNGIQSIDMKYNNWGDITGPHQSIMNPDGLGDDISDIVQFYPWMNTFGMDFLENVTLEPLHDELNSYPGTFVQFQIRLDNNGSSSFDVILGSEATSEFLTVLFPIGLDIDPVDPGESITIPVVILVDVKASSGTANTEITFALDGTDYGHRRILLSVGIDPTYKIEVMQLYKPVDNKIEPGANYSYGWKLTNNGTGLDRISLEIPELIGGERNYPEGWSLTLNSVQVELGIGESFEVELILLVPLYSHPMSTSIELWFHYANGTMRKIVDVEATVIASFQPKFGDRGGIYQLKPEFETSAIKIITLTVSNQGNVQDTIAFEFGADSITNRYRDWISLPFAVDLDPGEIRTVDAEILINPQDVDLDAIADGTIRTIVIRGYSVEARDNDIEVPGETTDDYLCGIDLLEYQYASISSITPWTFTIENETSALVNVTIQNLGNGVEEYTFVNDGLDGTGTKTHWYTFLVNSVTLEPQESQKVGLLVNISSDASVGLKHLKFHIQSESAFATAQEEVLVDVLEIFGGAFVSGDSQSSKPGNAIDMEITVRNTGNEQHEFAMDNPILPTHWEFSWSGGHSKSIDGGSSSTFTLRITIPSDFPKAPAGEYHFPVTGLYEVDGGAYAPIPNFADLTLYIVGVHDVKVRDLDEENQGKPGETVEFSLSIENLGNLNDTFSLLFLNPLFTFRSAKQWCQFVGLDPGNTITLASGDMKFFSVIVSIPYFSNDMDDALEGSYGFKVKAKSQFDNDAEDDEEMVLYVEPIYGTDIWADIPGKQETIRMTGDTKMTYTILVQNLGNIDDDIVVSVPEEETSGDKDGWSIKFGSSSQKTLALKPLEVQATTLSITIPLGTYATDYTIKLACQSGTGLSNINRMTIFVNLTRAEYGVSLGKFSQQDNRKINPVDESEIEFKFTLTNTGNQDDQFFVEIVTPLTYGAYRDWIMTFENDDQERVNEIIVPKETLGATDEFLGKNDRIDITFFVTPAVDAVEMMYEDIMVSVTSVSDPSITQLISYTLTIIRPNIMISNDPNEFNIDENYVLEEGDSVGINLRVFNEGSADTGTFYVFFYNGRSDSINENTGNYIAYVKIDDIPKNSYQDIFVVWENIGDGENDIFAHADKPIRSGLGATKDHKGSFLEEGNVAEIRENDNTASIDDRYSAQLDLRPDLAIVDIDWGSTKVDETTTVSVTIANLGTAWAETGSATVSLKIGGVSMRSSRSNAQNPSIERDIGPNDELTMEFKWEIKEVHNYTVKATVDHHDDKESDNDRLLVYVKTQESDEGIQMKAWSLIIIGLILAVGTIFAVALVITRTNSNSGSSPPGSRLTTARTVRISDPNAKLINGSLSTSYKSTPAPSGSDKNIFPTVHFGKTVNDGVNSNKANFPLIDLCPDCGAKLRVYRPGPIRCPFCHSTSLVDENGRFSLQEGSGSQHNTINEQSWEAMDRTDNGTITVWDSPPIGGDSTVDPSVTILEDGEHFSGERSYPNGSISEIPVVEFSISDTSSTIHKPHWEDNELERKKKILYDIMLNEHDPELFDYIRSLKHQIRTMESYGKRNIMGFPSTSFIAAKKEELLDVMKTPPRLQSKDDRYILKRYPSKIMAFERLVGMSVEELVEVLKDEEMKARDQLDQSTLQKPITQAQAFNTYPNSSNMNLHDPSKMNSHDPSNTNSHDPSNMNSHDPSKMNLHDPSNMNSLDLHNTNSLDPSNKNSLDPSNMNSLDPSNINSSPEPLSIDDKDRFSDDSNGTQFDSQLSESKDSTTESTGFGEDMRDQTKNISIIEDGENPQDNENDPYRIVENSEPSNEEEDFIRIEKEAISSSSSSSSTDTISTSDPEETETNN